MGQIGGQTLAKNPESEMEADHEISYATTGYDANNHQTTQHINDNSYMPLYYSLNEC